MDYAKEVETIAEAHRQNPFTSPTSLTRPVRAMAEAGCDPLFGYVG